MGDVLPQLSPVRYLDSIAEGVPRPRAWGRAVRRTFFFDGFLGLVSGALGSVLVLGVVANNSATLGIASLCAVIAPLLVVPPAAVALGAGRLLRRSASFERSTRLAPAAASVVEELDALVQRVREVLVDLDPDPAALDFAMLLVSTREAVVAGFARARSVHGDDPSVPAYQEASSALAPFFQAVATLEAGREERLRAEEVARGAGLGDAAFSSFLASAYAEAEDSRAALEESTSIWRTAREELEAHVAARVAPASALVEPS